jgi:hypothetical protein
MACFYNSEKEVNRLFLVTYSWTLLLILLIIRLLDAESDPQLRLVFGNLLLSRFLDHFGS